MSFTWEGAWEYDRMSGSGRVTLRKDGRLKGLPYQRWRLEHVHRRADEGAIRADPASPELPLQVAKVMMTGYPLQVPRRVAFSEPCASALAENDYRGRYCNSRRELLTG